MKLWTEWWLVALNVTPEETPHSAETYPNLHLNKRERQFNKTSATGILSGKKSCYREQILMSYTVHVFFYTLQQSVVFSGSHVQFELKWKSQSMSRHIQWSASWVTSVMDRRLLCQVSSFCFIYELSLNQTVAKLYPIHSFKEPTKAAQETTRAFITFDLYRGYCLLSSSPHRVWGNRHCPQQWPGITYIHIICQLSNSRTPSDTGEWNQQNQINVLLRRIRPAHTYPYFHMWTSFGPGLRPKPILNAYLFWPHLSV